MAKKLKKKKVLKKKVLKKKFLKKKAPKIELKIKRRPIVKPVGRWCTEKSGKLPSPIECHCMKGLNRACLNCDTSVNYRRWREGAYDKIEDSIDAGIDFTDPENIPVFVDEQVNTTKRVLKKKRKKKNKKE